jgi:hypothetical protein
MQSNNNHMTCNVTKNIYIPRMLVNITNYDMIKIFHDKNIGRVRYIDKHFKINNTRQRYSFCFIVLEFYDNLLAKYIADNIEKRGIIPFVYNDDCTEYWELRKHIPQIQRISKSPIQAKLVSYDDRLCLAKEYEQLAREIFQICCIR